VKIKILNRRDDFLELEALEEDPSLFDSLSEILQGMKGVQYAGMIIEHPLTRRILLRMKTDPSQVSAPEALRQAVEKLEKLSGQLREALEKL